MSLTKSSLKKCKNRLRAHLGLQNQRDTFARDAIKGCGVYRGRRPIENSRFGKKGPFVSKFN
jgi:hypothetical protein